MEKDGKTRVYLTSARQQAWEVYPEHKHHEEEIVGQAALAILSQVDYRGVNYESYKLNHDGSWGEKVKDVWSMQGPNGKYFDINRKGWKPDERYSRLAKILEKKARKKGLTIVLS